jgi:16S rRNA (cytosine967-C5)-methyltransferase
LDFQGRQLAILQLAMKHVEPRGRLIYSTCSLEPEENSEVVEKAVAHDRSLQIIDCREELARLRSQGEVTRKDLDSLTTGRYLRTIPGIHACDGFFAAVLEKI